jgi:pimeloyl-ACP methyl ester carboxylesterase
LRDVTVNKLFVRDLKKRWYLRGLGDLATNPQEASLAIRELLAEHDLHHTIAIGESMGGYAALLFGALVGSDEVHAFAPQTFLPARKGRILWDTLRRRYWQALLSQARLQLDPRVERRYFDLRPFLLDTGLNTAYHIYYCTDNARDVQHAAFIAGLPAVNLHVKQTCGHHVGKAMRDSGELAQVLAAAVQQVELQSEG